MSPSFRWLMSIAVSALACQSHAAGLLSLERMGAGAAAGWRVQGEGYTWEAERDRGPLGSGAGRIAFAGKGSLELDSPARALRADVPHRISLWLKSEPVGAVVELRLGDNDHDNKVFLSQSFTATAKWQRVQLDGVPGAAVKGRYWLNVRMRGEHATLWVDGLWLGECAGAGKDWKAPVHSAGVVLTPEAPWGLVTGAEVMRVRARVVGVTKAGCGLRLRAVNTSGASQDLATIPLDTAGVWDGQFEVPGPVADVYGMLRVEAVAVDAQGKALSPPAETLLARAPAPVPGPLPDSPFGVHVQMKDPDLSVAAKLGYKWCRIHDASGITKWAYVEPEPGKWTWFDEQVATARSHGLSVVGLLDGAPKWESGDPDEGYWSIYHAPAKVEDWRAYVRQVTGHYAGAIDEWEVWNEPWNMYGFFQGGSVPQYAALMRAAYEEAKAVNPACTIVGIDTYPGFWEQGVLAFGGYRFYDVASWHRYDSNLSGRMNDPISRVNERINAEQSKYGPAKPLICSEGGIDVTPFHGSFFSFADPALFGTWERGADAYPRMYLSILAAGSKRFISYSIHSLPRHGLSTHNMVEPNWLLRPLHLALSGLAHFIEGAHFEKRVAPAPDVTAMLFSQPHPRDFASGPCTIAVIFADGEEPEALLRPLPEGVKCFDRFGNAAPVPNESTRAPLYVVAEGEAAERLRKDLEQAPEQESRSQGVDGLLGDSISLMKKGGPVPRNLFSSQTSLAVFRSGSELAVARRNDLAKNAAGFVLPEDAHITGTDIRPAGLFSVGSADIETSKGPLRATFGATQDGPGGLWRYTCLTLLPKTGADATQREAVLEVLRLWEGCLMEGHTRKLHRNLYHGPCAVAANTLNGEYFTFDNPENLITMLNTAVIWGPAGKSKMHFDSVDIHGNVATVVGRWSIQSIAFGIGIYQFVATLIEEDGVWGVASLCVSAP